MGNVALRLRPTERPDTWEVQGRGELQLAVLIETMRREGFELTVGKPQVVTREIDGVLHEPMERVAIDVPDDYLGVVTQLMALRKGVLIEMVNHGTGWVRMDYRVPARGLVGFRTEFLTETRGTGMLHHVFDGWAPWHGAFRTKRNGSMVADRLGVTTTATRLMSSQERGTLLRRPGHGGLRGDGRRGERPGRGDGREPDEGEEADQHPRRRRRRMPSASPRRSSSRSSRLSNSSPRTSASRSRPDPCGCAKSSSTRPPEAGSAAGPGGQRLSGARATIRIEGSEGRARTSNIWLQRPAFCQLNYLGTVQHRGLRCDVHLCVNCRRSRLPPHDRPGAERCRRLSLAGIGQNGQR